MSFQKATRKQRKAQLRAKEQRSAGPNAYVTRRELADFLKDYDEVKRELQEARTAVSVLTMVLEGRNIVTRKDLGGMLDSLQVHEIENTLNKLKAEGLTKDALVRFLRSNRIDPDQFRDVLKI